MSIFLLKHSVDLSLLTKGFNIQTAMHKFVYALLGEVLHHGESREIKVLIEDETFTAKLYNIDFDQTKYPGHPDLLQVRFSPTSPIAKKLQSIFVGDYQYLLTAREIVGKRKQIQLPDNNHDEVVFSGTDMKGVFIIECMRGVERDSVADEIRQMNELDFETFEPREDKSATIKTVERIQKVRQLDRSIGDTLKRLYDYRCQMTGKKIGSEHEVVVVEAHHIIPFTESLNNDTSNIIILSPNYHRIIHKAKPIWDSKNLSFCFPNGLVEKIKLNRHLNIT